MFDQLTPGPTRPLNRSAKAEDFAGTVAAALFFGPGLLLITSALDEAGQQAPSRLSAEALPPACRPIVGSWMLDPVTPHIAELCANYY